ncbi:MAG: hypothetical protein H6698_08920 [Myxococcales bacterium]|nr:hypothetical protein [Myxococcales bacterium]MCB9534407.1 hypothetical protein [Myxococcales bacterium]
MSTPLLSDAQPPRRRRHIVAAAVLVWAAGCGRCGPEPASSLDASSGSGSVESSAVDAAPSAAEPNIRPSVRLSATATDRLGARLASADFHLGTVAAATREGNLYVGEVGSLAPVGELGGRPAALAVLEPAVVAVAVASDPPVLRLYDAVARSDRHELALDGMPVAVRFDGARGVVWALTRGPGGSHVTAWPTTLGGLAEPVVDAALGAGGMGLFPDATGGWLVPSHDAREVTRLDYSGLTARWSLEAPERPAAAVGLSGSAFVVSATGPTVTIFRSNQDPAIVELDGPGSAITTGDGAVFVASASSGTVTRLDPNTGTVTASRRGLGLPTALLVAPPGLWVADGGPEGGAIHFLDAVTLEELAEPAVAEGRPGWLFEDGGVVVSVSPAEGVVQRWAVNR